MLFPTIDFAVFFLVVFTGSWLLRPRKVAWKVFILCASFFFYGYWFSSKDDLPLTGLLAFSIVVNWAFGQAIFAAIGPGRGAHRPQPLAGAGRGRRRPRRARLLQVRQLLPRLVHRAPGHRRRAHGRAVRQRPAAHRHLLLHLPGHQLRDRHRPGRVAATGRPARLRRVPVVLRPPGGRSDRAGQRVRPPTRIRRRPPLRADGRAVHADLPGPVQEGRHLELHGHHRRPGVRPAPRLQLLADPVGDLRLRHPDLRRLLRLHRHRHRGGAAARHPLPRRTSTPPTGRCRCRTSGGDGT